MYIQVRYSTKNKFSKYINLIKPVSFKEAREETVEVYEDQLVGDCEDNKLVCEDMYYRFNVDPQSYINTCDLKNSGCGHTSMSVGDIVIINEKWYQVLPIGFAEIVK